MTTRRGRESTTVPENTRELIFCEPQNVKLAKRKTGRWRLREMGRGIKEICQTSEREGQSEGGWRKNSNSNSKTLMLKDSSVRSIWTYVTASLCHTTNINKHGYTTYIISTNKQLVNAVSQTYYKRAGTSELKTIHE